MAVPDALNIDAATPESKMAGAGPEAGATNGDTADPAEPLNKSAPLIKYMTLAEWGTFTKPKHPFGSDSGTAKHVFEILIDEQVRMARKPQILDEKTRKASKSTRSPIGAIPPSWSKVRALRLLINSKELIDSFKGLVPKFNWDGPDKTGKVVLVRPYKFLVLYEAEIREQYRLIEKVLAKSASRILPPLSPPPSWMSQSPEIPPPTNTESSSTLESDVESKVEASPPENTAEGTEEVKKQVSSGDDMLKAPIRFKDAVGRKFSFPFHMCKTWKGMEALINEAFLHVDIIGPHVKEGHYDLISPEGEIILRQAWETMVQPDWAVTMHIWPMPEPPPPSGPPEPPRAHDARKRFGRKYSRVLKHLGLLIRFMDEDLQDLFELRRRIQDGTLSKIAFDDLWHLFDYGQEVFIRNKINPEQIKAARVLKFTGGRSSRVNDELKPSGRPVSVALGPGSWGHAFAVQCWTLSFDSYLYWPQEEIVGIRPYEGEVEITSLPVYPSKFEKRSQVRLNLVERGKLYSRFASTTSSHRRYVGRNFDEDARGEHIDSEVIIDFKEALNAINDWSPRDFSAEYDQIDHDLSELWEEYPEHGHCNIKGWCIRECIGPDFSLDNDMLGAFIRDNKQAIQPRESLNEEDIILLPDRVFGYVLNRKTRAILTTAKDCLSNVQKTSAPWEDLVLEEKTKHIVEALVDQHIQRPTDKNQNDTPFQLGDFIAGKGRGLVLLLHGPPGVGKTSTAECIAAHMNKPLYPLTSGNLPVRPDDLETQLQGHFNLAERWGCILLLDEADVFLQRRQLHALEINAMVSVFLRHLEYYKGILFLTTNRVGDMDPAFKSRIHVSLEYDPLDQRRTKKIYKLHLRRIEEALKVRETKFTIRKEEILAWAMKHFKSAEKEHRQWNGRQIHNAFQTAVALAEWESRSEALSAKEDGAPKVLVLGKKQFKQVAVVSEGFDQYMMDLMGGKDESDMAAINAQRYDFRPSKLKGKEKARSESDDSDSEDSDSSNNDEPKKAREKKINQSDDDSDDSDERKLKVKKRMKGKKAKDTSDDSDDSVEEKIKGKKSKEKKKSKSRS